MAPQAKHDPVEAERLKVLGNELYQKGEYEPARHKYTQAIEKDPLNAVLYANRAAVLLATKQYFDAAYDCKKATELDPSYAKAWGRLGTASHALQSWDECMRAWQKALECLPKQDLTPAQQTMKNQFTQGLEKAKVARTKIESGMEMIGADTIGQRPWEIAASLRLQKLNTRKSSCTYTLAYAYEEFSEGMGHLAQLKSVTHPQLGVPAMQGSSGCLAPLSNSVLTDERVFHITDGEFPDKIRQQCLFENQYHRGWMTEGGPTIIKEQVLQRLKTEGWNKVRPAISTTIRIMVFQAFFRSQLLGHHEFAHEALTRSLEFLEWGRKEFPKVSRGDRGVVFERSWIRGVKRQHLMLMHCYVATQGVKGSPFNHQDLVDAARDLIEDVGSDPIAPGSEVHPGHLLAYWVYPKAHAMSILGWSHMQVGMSAPEGDPSKYSCLQTAAGYYLSAAEAFPQDDEYHPAMLRKHLECVCLLDKPLKVTLPICDRIRDVMPQAMEVWKIGPSGQQLKNCLREVREFETHWRAEMREGRATMESVGKIFMPTVPKLKTEKDGLPIKFKFRD